MFKSFKNKKGFTIIEMLAVVAIIGLLSGILYVSYEKYIKESREQMCKTQVLQICDSIELKMIENVNKGTRKSNETISVNNFVTYDEFFVLVEEVFDEDLTQAYGQISDISLPEGATLEVDSGDIVYCNKGVELKYDPIKKVFK